MKRKKKTETQDQIVDTKKAPSPAIWWFILALIPVLNLYWYWKVSKMITESKRNVR